MAIVFPASPSVNDTFTEGSITYKWDGAKWIGLGVTPADRLVEGSNKLEIDGSNNLVWTGGSVGIGLTNPGSKLHVEGLSSLSTTLDVGGISLSDTDTITYPTTSSFQVTAGNSVNIELGTSQTVTSGFNFVTADKRTYTKSAGTTSDIERLYFAGFNQSFNWTDANTCKQYIGFNDGFSYQGINANGRSSSAFNAATTIALSPPDGGTQSIVNVTSPALLLRPNGTSTVNVTNYTSYSPTVRLFSIGAGTKTVNITNAHFYDTNSFWGSVVNSGTLDATITNLYGLRLRPPNNTTGLTVTNNYGVYQEWSDATNYFAGNIQMGQGKGIDFSANANAAGMSSEVLDDYEEGTWSPEIKGWNGSYSVSEAGYIKIGRQVFISGEVKTDATTGTGTNSWPGLSNLPFVNTTSFHPVGGSQRYMGNGTLLGDVSPSGSGMAFVTFDRFDGTSFFPNHITPTGASNFQNTMINNITTVDFGMRFNCTYFTD